METMSKRNAAKNPTIPITILSTSVACHNLAILGRDNVLEQSSIFRYLRLIITYNVEILWSVYFQKSEDEKKAAILLAAVLSGLTADLL